MIRFLWVQLQFAAAWLHAEAPAFLTPCLYTISASVQTGKQADGVLVSL
jgi:hypothetical protein